MTETRNRKDNILQVIVIVAAVCLVFALMQGIHDNYGIMTTSLMERVGLDYAKVSFIIGVGALLYGVAQPFMGMLALKKSNTFVMLLGMLLMAVGLFLTPFSTNFVTLLLTFGIILPVGTTGIASGILMSAITPLIGEKRSVLVSGILQASAGVGDALMSPGLEHFISVRGIAWTLSVFAIPFVAMIPIALWIGGKNRALEKSCESPLEGETLHEEKESLGTILKTAFQDRDYICILLGFGTCGFNMSIIESHLFNQYVSYGIPSSTASLTLTVYGIMTMLGAILTGYLGTKFKMKNVLGITYATRVFISLGFLLLPKTVPFAFSATALLGLSGDSTVPPTMGTITRKFDSRKMPVLYGFALVGHQIGAFASASLGGLFVKHGMGYAPLWIMNLCLAAFAATASYLIREPKPADR